MDVIHRPTQTTCMMCVGGIYRHRHRQSSLTARAGQIRFCGAGARAGCPLAGTKHVSGSVPGPSAGGIDIQYLALVAEGEDEKVNDLDNR